MRTAKLRPPADTDMAVVESEFDVHVRQLDGAELMQIIGFSAASLRHTTEFPSHALCTSLAGNAFSAYAIAPCLTALLAAVQPDCAWQRKSSFAVSPDKSVDAAQPEGDEEVEDWD